MCQPEKLIHSGCGGELALDLGFSPIQEKNETGGTDTYEGVICARCGARLGLLANIRREPYGGFTIQ
jgi:hypothetical protein